MPIELLRRAATTVPDQPVVISGDRSISYGDCVERAERLAGVLAAERLDRFGVTVDDPAGALLLLAAAALIGAEPCLYTRWIEPEHAERLASTFDHDVVVCDPGQGIPTALARSLPDLLDSSPATITAVPNRAPLLILTTGTTGNQRGVRHDWSRLIAATGHHDPEPGGRWLLAYNLSQFGGLQVLLHALASRATLVAPASRRPADVVAAMKSHGVTRASATPTLWRMIAGTLDAEGAAGLALDQITLGGEPVHGALLERLRALFPSAQLSQIYGATEFGTAVSVRDGRPGLPLSVLDRPGTADVRLRISDGELEMATRIGMDGYYGEEDARDGWRPTGDLVEIEGDRIVFRGRRSEIINVGGAKVHPLPIEAAVSGVPGVELAAAYGRSNPVTGQIVALDVVPSPGADTAAVEAAIRAACATLPAAARPRRVRFVDEMPTQGHKLTRGARA